MYLIDTNVWLELLLEQEKAKDVRHFLEAADPVKLHITEFTLYSIGIVLIRLKKTELLLRFVRDALLEAEVELIRLGADEIESLVNTAERFNLDFDDAYQYVVAEKIDLEIISFDSDFDRTDRGRKTPDNIKF